MQLERLNLNSKSGTEINLDALYQICPACFTEAKDESGELRRVVDFGKLKEFLGEAVVEDVNEAYEFTWVGKNAAKREAAAPINKTLRPYVEESGRGMQKRNFDSELKSLNDRPSNQASICKATSSPKLNGVF